ncbi:PQQ-dependent sugar dehydrogenase [Mycobacterium sp. pV006]|uniref:PQQ-dependent sugar dehydrogenase n=1 Tax=Mycobacterium sp. pV006 TaxID=3238983 RepID=UPI00351B6FAA
MGDVRESGRSAAGSARYVGRVGGLAFALGVGAAVLTGQAVASADTGDRAGSSSSASSSTESSSSSSSSSRTERGPAARSESTSTSTKRTRAEAAESAADTEADLAAEDDAVETDSEPVDDDSAVSAAQDASMSVAAHRSSRTENRQSTGEDAGADRVTQAAAPTPWQRFFDNQTPRLGHRPSENTVVNGVVTGELRPEDPDSTRLTYTATRPSHGTVTIDSDGGFVYKPGATFAGQDRFTVTVSDVRSGFHIHGLAGLLNLVSFGLLGNSGHRSNQTVFIGYERATVVGGLDQPVDFRFLDDGRILVAEKAGAIRLVENGVVRPQPLATLKVSTLGERGIGGLEVDPDFDTNGYLYVAYTTEAPVNQLSRFTVVGDTVDLDSELVLLRSEQLSAVNHHGGALGFGPDGKLYWGVGDNARPGNAQDLTNIHGKILRINPDGSVPDDNPDLGLGTLPQIYAYGLRNPFRLTFAPTEQLLVADVGAASWEELNLVTASGNYGWPGAEGECTSNCGGVTDPIYTYPRGTGAAITSVLVYNGSAFGSDFRGKVFIADTVQGWIRVLTCSPDFSSCTDPKEFDPEGGPTLVLREGPDGNIYQLLYSGSLVQISPGTRSV